MGVKQSMFVGDSFYNREGYKMIVVAYKNNLEVRVLFETGYETTASTGNIRRGSVRDKLLPTKGTLNVFGEGKYKSYSNGKHTKENRLWGSMLARVDNSTQKRDPSYMDVSVASEWRNFQVFSEWCNQQPEFFNKGSALDKDILIKGNKVYSPDTCCFVPPVINSLFVKANKVRGECLIGVYKRGDKFTSKVGVGGKEILLGHFKTEEEAFEAYKKAKELNIQRMAKEYRNSISDRCYKALMEYKVERTD